MSPNGQGIVTLIILGILEYFNVKSMPKNDYIHLFCEAVKIDILRDQYLADTHYKLSEISFLSKKSLEQYASKLILIELKNMKSLFPDHPDTVYLTVRDKNE